MKDYQLARCKHKMFNLLRIIQTFYITMKCLVMYNVYVIQFTALQLNPRNPIESKQTTPYNADDSPSPRPQSKFFVPLNVPETGPKIKPGSRGPPPEKPPPPKMLSNRKKLVEELDWQRGSRTPESFSDIHSSSRREESIDFDNFSKERNQADPTLVESDLKGDSRNAQSDWGNLVDIDENSKEATERKSNDEEWPLFSKAVGVAQSEEDNLFDVGSSDPTNLELLMGCEASNKPEHYVKVEQSKVEDNLFELFSQSRQSSNSLEAKSNNPFENGTSASVEEVNKRSTSEFSSFHSSFDPFNSIPSAKQEKSSTPPVSEKNSRDDDDDFLSFLENISNGPSAVSRSKPGSDHSPNIFSKPTKSGSSDDLLGTWNHENLTANLNSMPRPSSFVTFSPTSSSPAFGCSVAGNKGPNHGNGRPPPNGSFTAQERDSNFDPFVKFGLCCFCCEVHSLPNAIVFECIINSTS